MPTQPTTITNSVLSRLPRVSVSKEVLRLTSIEVTPGVRVTPQRDGGANVNIVAGRDARDTGRRFLKTAVFFFGAGLLLLAIDALQNREGRR